jgi:hypothetical protein
VDERSVHLLCGKCTDLGDINKLHGARLFFEKLIVAWLVKNFQAFYEK